MHQLPDVVDVRNITANEQGPQIFFHHQLDGQMPVSEGTAAQAIQARLAGFHLHHQKVDAFRRGADGFDVSDGYHRFLSLADQEGAEGLGEYAQEEHCNVADEEGDLSLGDLADFQFTHRAGDLHSREDVDGHGRGAWYR